MSHITEYIDDSLTGLSKEDIIKIYLEIYPETPEEDRARIISSLTLTHSFDNGGYIEDANAYILVIVPATTNTLIIKQTQKQTQEKNI
jgi:hypothetical protein